MKSKLIFRRTGMSLLFLGALYTTVTAVSNISLADLQVLMREEAKVFKNEQMTVSKENHMTRQEDVHLLKQKDSITEKADQKPIEEILQLENYLVKHQIILNMG